MQKQINRKTTSLSILALAGVEPYQITDNEQYMNDAQLLHFKHILTTWLTQIKSETSNNTSIQNSSVHFPDPIDRAVQEEEFSLELRNRNREQNLIHKIEQTLTKIKNRQFGFCELCDVEIGIKRLEAQPTANLCIDCKMLAEIREKQIAK